MTRGQALVAVNDAELRQRIVAALRDLSPLEVDDREAAIDHLWHAAPGVVILDLDLPRLSAYDVIRHLSMRRPELLSHLIVLTPEGDQITPLLDTLDIRYRFTKPVVLAALADLARTLVAREG